MKSKINIPVGVALFVALALLALSAVLTLPQLAPGLVFGQAETPLQPPTNLTAVMVGQKNIALFWTPAANGVGYRIERSEDGHTGWAMVETDEPVLLATTIHNDTVDLKLSTTYHYRVSTTTTIPARRSRPSNVANATTGGVERPGAPGLDAAGVEPRGPSRIDLTWTVPASDGGGDITGYQIEYSDADATIPPANTWRELETNTGNVKLTYTDDGTEAGLEEGDQRHYRVSAINSAGVGTASPSARSDPGTPAGAMIETSAPTGLMAMAMGPTQIDLSWTAPTDTSGDEITGYQIEYSDLDRTNDRWGVWGDLKTDTENDETTFTDDGSNNEDAVGALLKGTTRQYRVYAINAATGSEAFTADGETQGDGISEPSNVANATTAEATVPGKPKAPTLAPMGAQAITVEWTAPTDTGGSAITGYRIERSESTTSWPAKLLVKNTAALNLSPLTSYPDTMVPKANTKWYYRVSAINAEGTGEASDAAFAATPPPVAPGAPMDLTAWEEGPTRIVLQWKAPAMTGGEITGYKVEYSADGNNLMELVADTGNDATTYTDNGSVAELKAGDTRFYRVTAINSGGTSLAASNQASAMSGTMALQPPTRLTATNTGQKSITLSWAAPSSGATRTGYMVERSEDRRTGWEEVTPSDGRPTMPTHNDRGTLMGPELELSTAYYYRVSTVDATQRSRPSTVVNATTGPVARPGAPELDDVVPRGPSRIDLSWTFNASDGGSDITGYQIEYSDADATIPPANTWRELETNTGNVKLTYTDDGTEAGLEEGDQRHYRVSAINSAGAGMASPSMRAVILERRQMRMVVTSAPTGLMAMAMGPTQIDLSWTAPTDTSGDEIMGYKIEYSPTYNVATEALGWLEWTWRRIPKTTTPPSPPTSLTTTMPSALC